MNLRRERDTEHVDRPFGMDEARAKARPEGGVVMTEELILQYSYGIIADWPELVKRIKQNNLVVQNGVPVSNVLGTRCGVKQLERELWAARERIRASSK